MNTTQTILVSILVVVALGVGWLIGSSPSNKSVVHDAPKANTGVTQQPVGTETKVDSSNLTEGQIKLMKALGVDPASVTITPAMVACAESSLGGARVEEIKNGATPSIIEGGKLVACYNS